MIEKEKLNAVCSLFEHCAPIFIGLGDAQRQKLFLDIAEYGEDGLNVSALAAKSKLSRPAVSHHLKILKDCGIIVPIKKGTQIFYRLKILNAVNDVQNLLDELKKLLEELNISEDD